MKSAEESLGIDSETYNKIVDECIYGEQKPAWSEEDNQIALSIEQVMNCASLLNIVPEKMDKIRTWLKSLKDKYTWKPSDEQIDALEDAIADAVSSIQKNMLNSLYQDLKKLKP